MPARPKRPISRKLSLLVLAAIGVAVTVVLSVSLWQETVRYVDARRQWLLATAETFAATTAQAIAAGDAVAAMRAMRAIGRIDGIPYARAETRDGRVLAALGSVTRLDRDARHEDGGAAASTLGILRSRSIEVAVPIVDAGETVGRFVLVGDLADLGARLLATLAVTLLGAGAALAIGLLVARRLQRAITGPLRSLTATVTRVRTSHDYSADATTTSDDEVGLLVDGFNDMLHAIRERDARIEAHLQNLEREVADRTEDLRHARDAAEAANLAKSDFLATMSHEIRTPMNGIMVMAELLAAGDLPDRQRRYAEVIAKSGQSLVAIINDILDVSKIESGKLELERVPVDLGELAADVTTLFAERAQAKGLDLAAYVDPALPNAILGDPVRLNQVLGNFVNNALKFTESGHILLSIERDGDDRIRFAVTDTGIGIPADKVDTIFEAFTQADQSTTRRFGGTGLGLAICKRLIAAMGAEVRVESVVGRGSTFAFSLPAEPASAPPPWPTLAGRRALVRLPGAGSAAAVERYLAAAGLTLVTDAAEADLVVADAAAVAALPPFSGQRTVLCLAGLGEQQAEALARAGKADAPLSAPPVRSEIGGALAAVGAGRSLASGAAAPGRRSGERHAGLPRFPGLRVLVADDSAVNREVAVEALAQLGCTDVALAENGLEAVAKTAAERFDLVLMDGSMPELDGFAAARQIRAREAETGGAALPIVALTAHVVGRDADAWRHAGMDGVLHKPFTLRALAETLLATVDPAVRAARAEAPAAEPAPVAAAADDLSPDAAPLLDPDMLEQLDDMAAAGRTDFVERVFGLYLEHAPAAAAELDRTMGVNDLDAVGRSAHALKSMSYNIGASRVAREAAAIETAAREQGRRPEPAEVAALRRALDDTLAAVRQRLGRADAAPQPAPAAREPAASDLARALAQGEFRVVYQPLVDRTGTTTAGVEALVRWNRPGLGEESPAAFIPQAEQSGDIVAIGAFVLSRACEQALAWPSCTLAVNVSPVQIQRPGFAESVERILDETGFDPRRLELEITESALLAAEDGVVRTIDRLRRHGISFALDDFGTGYSSLAYLRRFPFNKIKIDRSFVESIETAIDAAAIIHAVASIGRSLGMKIVAEGVETEAQQQFLAAAGVHFLQGYRFARPMEAEAIGERLAAERAQLRTAATA